MAGALRLVSGLTAYSADLSRQASSGLTQPGAEEILAGVVRTRRQERT